MIGWEFFGGRPVKRLRGVYTSLQKRTAVISLQTQQLEVCFVDFFQKVDVMGQKENSLSNLKPELRELRG